MQAIVIEDIQEVENMGGVYRIPTTRRGVHSCDLILTRDTAQMLVAQLLDRIAEDDQRPSNLVCFSRLTKTGASA